MAQVLLRKRFTQVIVHAGRQARFAVTLQRIGRDGDDGQHARVAALLFMAADFRRGGKAVHHGHLAVHQDQIEILGLRRLQGFFAVVRAHHVQAQAVEHGQRHFHVDWIVLGQQHAAALAPAHLPRRVWRMDAHALAGARRRDDAVEQVAFAGRLDQLEGHARLAPLHGVGRRLFRAQQQ